jgi:crotonobetainyl-CoA:carnitine CoA-transferase CaiB-like acyl-CoA transferase
MGAEVVKVEHPEGDPWRMFAQFLPGESKAYQGLNRGKRSLVLALQKPEAQAVVHRLIPEIDVVVINYRPDVPAKLGIDYVTLRAIREDLIHVDNTAFGRQGPLAQSPGYDIIAQAISGLMVREGKFDPESGTPKGSLTPISDYGTGLAIAWGVCAALYHRERTGEGQMVESMLLQTALAFQGDVVFDPPASGRGEVPEDGTGPSAPGVGRELPRAVDRTRPTSPQQNGEHLPPGLQHAGRCDRDRRALGDAGGQGADRAGHGLPGGL